MTTHPWADCHRALAYEAVGIFAQRLQSEQFRAQPQLDALLRGIRRGVKAPFERIPAVGGAEIAS